MRTQAQQDFTATLVTEFPDLRQEVEDCNGQLLYEMDAFASHTQAAKMRGDWPVYQRCVQLADSLLASEDAALNQAIRSSYLEHLDFEGSRGPEAWRHLTPALQAAWEQIAAMNRRLMALPQTGRRSSQPSHAHHGPPGPGGPRKKRSSSRKKPRGRRR